MPKSGGTPYRPFRLVLTPAKWYMSQMNTRQFHLLAIALPMAVVLAAGALCGCRSIDPIPNQPPPAPVERIGQIRIEGNTVTQERVILKQLDFTTGDLLDSKKVTKAETDLLRLGIFDAEDPPKITVGETDPTTGFKTIVVRVKETRTGVVVIGGGSNINRGYEVRSK